MSVAIIGAFVLVVTLGLVISGARAPAASKRANQAVKTNDVGPLIQWIDSLKPSQQPDVYNQVVVTTINSVGGEPMAPLNSADMVLTFRNAHNWVDPGYGEGAAQAGFQAMYDALKPGGVLGLVDHRWPDPATEDPAAENGYISEERIVALAEAAGFVLEANSDLLRNPADTHDHPEGVWTLPPSLALGDTDREKYLQIGESDRMLLRFRKPE